MKRSVVAAAICAALLAYPGRADAGIWDWIQELSGPGPSGARPGKNILSTFCFGGDGRFKPRPRVTATATSTGAFNKKPCLYADYRRFDNEDDDNFPADVTLSFYDVGPTWELLQEGQIEIGVGMGAMRSESNDVNNTQFTITLFRFTIQPLSLVPGWERNRWLSILKAYYRVTLIPGTIDATDFGVPLGSGPGQSTFSTDNDRVRSAGFIVDVFELFRR